MFELSQTECKCTSVSTNSENQGNSGETRLGLSVYVEFLASNEMLDKFDSKLRPALYESAANGAQTDLTGHLPEPKFKLAKPICWPYVGAGYAAAIHPEFDVNKPFDIEDVKVDKFQFAINDDGVVGYKFRLYFHPHLDDVGPLCALEKHTITLSLTAPLISEMESGDAEIEEHPQQDLLSENEPQTDVLYEKAVASVRATGNPTVSALNGEFKCGVNQAALWLSRMLDEGVIAKDGDEYFVDKYFEEVTV